jgi:Holliday junction DNA helicase RuvA
MLHSLRGRILEKGESWVALEAGGIGFKLTIPLSTHYYLPDEGEECLLYTVLQIGQQSVRLFGFHTKEEREIFLQLTSIPRLGSKAALAVISHLSIGDLWEAVKEEDVKRFQSIPGVGAKSASRLIAELKTKIPQKRKTIAGTPSALAPKELEGVVAALASLGYSKGEIEKALAKIEPKENLSEEEALKAALLVLG